jgi:hypothetical protein
MSIRHRTAAIAAITISIIASAAAAALPPLAADSAALDRSYIPALMLSNAKDPAKAAAAQVAYDKAWAEFAARQRNAQPGNAGWPEMFATIEKANADARAALVAGKLKDAHNAQEEVRHALWQERKALAVAYQPDLLTAFHAPMELLIDSVQDKAPAAIGAAEIAKMRPLFAQARNEWQAVKSAEWSREDYGFDAARIESYRAAVAAVDKAQDELAAALDSGDGAWIAKAAPALKAPFAKAYAAFGVFPQ